MTALNRQNVKMAVYVTIPIILIAVLGIFTFVMRKRHTGGSLDEPVVIALPYSELVQDYESNYYTGWLEDKTGYDISFVYLDEGYEKESMNVMFASENSSVDMVFFPMEQEIISDREYRDYIKKGLLCAPQDYLSSDSNLQRVQDSYPEADFGALLGEDGKIYCFPSMNMARTERNMQILWINIDWLKNLKLALPQTTEEFCRVMEAFRDSDPNGNGVADELPLVSCEEEQALCSYRYLINAFVYYDGTCLPWAEGDAGKEAETAFREGIAYCADLYGRGLLKGDCFTYTRKQLMELVNDPADMVGAFASRSIADVIYTNNPDVLAHFVQLAPLSSGFLERGCAVRTDTFPTIGGVIPANAVHKEAAAQIMDIMLSEEASLIALYGEEGVDWRPSRDGELSSYGTRARVTTIRYLKGEAQNQHYAGVGPLLAAAEYTDGVTWNGDHSMTEYIDARAVKTYEPYYGSGADGFKARHNSTAEEYLNRELPRYITGERDIGNDADWARFLAEYRRMEK